MRRLRLIPDICKQTSGIYFFTSNFYFISTFTLLSPTFTIAIEPGLMLVAMVAILLWEAAVPACFPSAVYTLTSVCSSIPSTVMNPLSVFTGYVGFDKESAEMLFNHLTRDSDNLFRVILTQPYVRCLRLATKQEIDTLVLEKGFHDNSNGQEVNYTSDRIALDDMHPANVFIDEISSKAICIDCIVKFIK